MRKRKYTKSTLSKIPCSDYKWKAIISASLFLCPKAISPTTLLNLLSFTTIEHSREKSKYRPCNKVRWEKFIFIQMQYSSTKLHNSCTLSQAPSYSQGRWSPKLHNHPPSTLWSILTLINGWILVLMRMFHSDRMSLQLHNWVINSSVWSSRISISSLPSTTPYNAYLLKLWFIATFLKSCRNTFWLIQLPECLDLNNRIPISFRI